MTEALTWDSTIILGHVAYALIFCSFLVKRMILLRLFAIAASMLSIIYNYNVSTDPIWVPIQWNALFIVVNIFHVAMAIAARRDIKLDQKEEFAYSTLFRIMTRVEFKRLLNCGFKRTFYTGQKIVEQDDELQAIFLILEGEAHVMVNGCKVAVLTKGEFIGEMSFLTNELTRADVIISKNSIVQYWDLNDLKTFFRKNPAVLASFHSAIGNQLISRLIAQSTKLSLVGTKAA